MLKRRDISVSLSQLSKEAQDEWQKNVESTTAEYQQVLREGEVAKLKARRVAREIYEGNVRINHHGEEQQE